MSIRPIDLKMAIPKTQEISKTEQNNQDRIKFALEAQTNEQNQNIEKQLKTVNSNDELSKSKIKEDEQNKSNKKNNQQKHGNNESSEQEEKIKDAKSDIVGTTFDIKA